MTFANTMQQDADNPRGPAVYQTSHSGAADVFLAGMEGTLTVPINGMVSITDISAGDFEAVAASVTGQVIGGTGAIGDYMGGILVVPATTSPGNVLLLDGGTSYTLFTGGASSVSNLVPFLIPLGYKSKAGPWKITTGANVSCIAGGNFT